MQLNAYIVAWKYKDIKYIHMNQVNANLVLFRIRLLSKEEPIDSLFSDYLPHHRLI